MEEISLMDMYKVMVGMQSIMLDMRGGINLLNKKIEKTNEELKKEISDVREELHSTKAELKKDIADVRTELKKDIADVREELHSTKAEFKKEISDVKTEITNVKKEVSNVKKEVSNVKKELDDFRVEVRENTKDLIDQLSEELVGMGNYVIEKISPIQEDVKFLIDLADSKGYVMVREDSAEYKA